MRPNYRIRIVVRNLRIFTSTREQLVKNTILVVVAAMSLAACASTSETATGDAGASGTEVSAETERKKVCKYERSGGTGSSMERVCKYVDGI